MLTEKIQPGNESLKYIDNRILYDKYRGSESSEHNRYDMEEIYKTLSLLNKHAPNKSLMRIRDTDLSKRPENSSEEQKYAHFAGDVKKAVGKGTQDSIRKNIFVDLHRMGLIKRFDKNKVSYLPFEQGSVKYISLSELGLKFVTEKNSVNRAFLFTKALDTLLGGYIELCLMILRDSENNISYITKYEFMFFVSAIDTDTNFNINIDQCINLINSYRLLSRVQKSAVIDLLKSELIPEKYSGDKTKKRDYHNWQNKIDQVYHLLNQTVYFSISGNRNEKLSLSTRRIATNDGKELVINKRSSFEKTNYMSKHKIKKQRGFELHHILPLSLAESPEQYKLFDNWLNMLYIDAFSHAKITQNRNKNIRVQPLNETDLILNDFTDNNVYLHFKKNIIYNPELRPKIIKYNQDLLNQ